MNSTTTLIDPSGQAIGESLYYALFRVAAIADLEGPAKAVAWAESILDDDQLREAFVAGVVSSEARGGVHHREKPTGADVRPSPAPGPAPRGRRHTGGPLQSSYAGHPRSRTKHRR
jgi:hypothetical protein